MGFQIRAAVKLGPPGAFPTAVGVDFEGSKNYPMIIKLMFS